MATVTADFESFVLAVEPRLRAALVARFGADVGREATAEALAFAWERWPAVEGMAEAPPSAPLEIPPTGPSQSGHDA